MASSGIAYQRDRYERYLRGTASPRSLQEAAGRRRLVVKRQTNGTNGTPRPMKALTLRSSGPPSAAAKLKR